MIYWVREGSLATILIHLQVDKYCLWAICCLISDISMGFHELAPGKHRSGCVDDDDDDDGLSKILPKLRSEPLLIAINLDES